MKKLFISIIVLFFIGVINVNAEEVYSILIDENNNFTLTDSNNNPVSDSSIAKYENNTLTLGEGKVFNEIKIKHDLTITSNKKGVSIKNLTTKEGNTYLPINVNINKLKVLDSETYYYQIDVGGNLIVDNSETYSKKDTEVKGYISINNSKITNKESINSRSSDSDGYGLKIINSEITSEVQIRPADGGSYFKNSKLNVKYIYSMGDFNIDNCEIITSYVTLNKPGEYKFIVKDSTIKSSGQFYILATGKENVMSIENSTIEGNSFKGYNRYASAGYPPASLQFKNSNITINNGLYMAGDLLLIENTDLTMGYLEEDGITTKIKKSNIKVTMNYVRSDIIDISDSNINIKNYIQAKKLSINNSEIELDYLYGNTNLDPDTEYNEVITNSKVIVHQHLSGPIDSNFLFKNSSVLFEQGVRRVGNLKFVNSTGQINEEININKDLILEDSILGLKNGKENITALFVENDLNIKNSNITIDNNTPGKVAAIIKNNIILDDKIVPIDDTKTVLKVNELTKAEIIDLMPSYADKIEDGTKVKIFAYADDSYSKYVKLASTISITFKVKNGTWSNGTKDDIKMNAVYGEKIEIDNLPEEVKKLLKSKDGEWSMDLNNLDSTKDLEIEFRYNLINPETLRNNSIFIAVLSAALVLFISIVLLKRQPKYKSE